MRRTSSGGGAPHLRRRTGLGAGCAAAVLAATLTSCGSSAGSGPPELTWYVNPDNGGQATIAQQCTEESGGAWSLEVSVLPSSASAQREQLMRRLAGNDSSIDLMSLDPVFVPETAEAGFLLPLPAELQDTFTDGIVEGAVQGASWKDELVTAPFWANTQLLWYRTSMVEAAGLDLSQPVTWQQVIDAAASQGSVLAEQGARAESMTVWVNAMVESAGGSVIENPEASADELRLGLDSDAGRAAADVMRQMTEKGVLGPGIDNRDEAATANLFQQDGAMFMLNWPFVYAQAAAAAEGGTMDRAVFEDYGWAQFPRMSADQESAPPLGGIDIGIGAFTEHPDQALEAVRCIVAADKQAAYMISDGNPAAAVAAYDDPAVREAFPMADAIRESLQNAAPRPQTAYYNEVSSGIQDTFQPVSGVSERTPEEAQEFITAVLRGERLL
ncbi:extracellular solute-binding protein [Kineococcus gynurae]|uniref:Extracellular solute-binding protein n=1 Tax=Kineococcus gynurae TaxID=452979 RepID=A0ABV5LNH8_9ACTN